MIAHGEVVDAGIVVLTVKFVNIFHLPRVEKTSPAALPGELQV